MEKVHWKVEGMSCTNCALTIQKYLQNQGLQHVSVNFAAGELSFENRTDLDAPKLEKGIEALGYHVTDTAAATPSAQRPKSRNRYLGYLLFCAPFTLLLMTHMLGHGGPFHFLMNPWVQLSLCLPVYAAGMHFFGRSAWKSIRNGIPNMNVLVALGSSAAFFYSLAGTWLHLGADFLFYESAAAILTFVFLGNYLESVSVRSTQRALQRLIKTQKVMANMIAFDDAHQEQVFPVENTQLRSGDLILIKSGEQVPTDCKILWGTGSLDESLLTGESLPQTKTIKDLLVGGSTLVDGTLKAQVTAAASDSVLARIIRMVQDAQAERPPIQLLADKISAIFVPVVVGIGLVTLILNWVILHQFSAALMRAVAVLVIACPCAMGLATPAAIAAGLGRAARLGILIRDAGILEKFQKIQTIVFDKTGTLTTGDLTIDRFQVLDPGFSKEAFQSLVYNLEKYSNHPIARTLSRTWKTKDIFRWKQVEEIKGQGIRALSAEGDTFQAGAFLPPAPLEQPHAIYVWKNDQLLGWIDLQDQLRPEAAAVVDYFKSQKIKTILLSGDHQLNCERTTGSLNLDETLGDQSPQRKQQKIRELAGQSPTAMVGDGINDAPALAQASIGFAISDASHLAMQTADVVLISGGLSRLPAAIQLGKATYRTIQQNLFWAFLYNLVAIPVAATGLLTPAWAALSMGFSDVLLVGNSVRLFAKKFK